MDLGPTDTTVGRPITNIHCVKKYTRPVRVCL
jgi:hypothetical protein